MKTNGAYIIDVDCLFRGSLRARQKFNTIVILHVYNMIKLRHAFHMTPQQLPIIMYNSRPSDDNEKLKDRILRALLRISTEKSMPWLLDQDLKFLQGRPDNFSWLCLTEWAPDIVPDKIRVFAKHPVLFQSCQRQQLNVTQAEKYGICKRQFIDKPVISKKRATVLVDLDDTALLRAPSLRYNVCEINSHVLSLCHFFKNQFEQCEFIVLTARSCVRSNVIDDYTRLLKLMGLHKNGLTVNQSDNHDLKTFINLMEQLISSPLQTNAKHPALIALTNFLNAKDIGNLVNKFAQLLVNKHPKADWHSLVSALKRLCKCILKIKRPTSTHHIVEAINEQGIPLEVKPWSFSRKSNGRIPSKKIDRINSNITDKNQAIIFIDDFIIEVGAAVMNDKNEFTEGLHVFMCHSDQPITETEILMQCGWLVQCSALNDDELQALSSPTKVSQPVDVDHTRDETDDSPAPKLNISCMI